MSLYMRLPAFSKRGRIISYVVICIGTLNALSGVVVNFALKDLSDAARDHGLMILWYINSGLSLPVDLTIWFLPIPIIFRLQKLDRRKKVGLILTFSLALICPITAIGRLCVVKEAARMTGDQAWRMTYIHILTIAEVGLAISAASMATLLPLLTKVLDWRRRTSKSLSTGTTAQPTRASFKTRRIRNVEGGMKDEPFGRADLGRTESTTEGSESDYVGCDLHHTDIEFGYTKTIDSHISSDNQGAMEPH